MIYEMHITTSAQKGSLLDEIGDRFSWLEQRGYSILTENLPDEMSSHTFVHLQLRGEKDTLYRDEDIIYIFKHQIAELIAEHIVKDWERTLIKREICRKNRRIPLADQDKVLDKAVNFLNSLNSSESLNLLMNYGRKNKIAHRILEHCYYNNKLVVEGFINFCMQDYLTEIKFAVDLAYEELNNEKEYNEFVKLLRYFVDTQPPRVFEVNLLMDNKGLFYLWDGNGTEIEDNYMDYFMDDLIHQDINLDDVLVSVLITVAPRRIVLHNTQNQHSSESVKMIRSVFAERIVECSGCDRCCEYRHGNDVKHRH
jgi:putative sporulation protein YtxC